jgi:hypothetical protein
MSWLHYWMPVIEKLRCAKVCAECHDCSLKEASKAIAIDLLISYNTEEFILSHIITANET